jgi:hypothetical protein
MALRPQILVFTYHKTGTALCDQVMRQVAARFGLTIDLRFGFVRNVNPAADLVLLPHSLVGPRFASRPFRAVRIVRDPRDIWVSGYLYHLHCPEGWCTNTNFDPTPPITYPRVDFSFQHYPEAWKQAYLAWLGGKSYQQNLRDRDRDSGLAFELAGYTGRTLEALRGWWLRSPDLLDIKLEIVMEDFDGSMRAIFGHLGFGKDECEAAIELAMPHDVARMSEEQVASNPHIHSRQISKWREYLSSAQVAAFEQRYGQLIVDLGYPLAASG